MAERKELPVATLLIDEENPRISSPNEGQRPALRALAASQGHKLQVLAKDILRHRLNPSDLPIVMPLEGDEERYIVLDGNRRLAALKALENPDSLVDTVPRGILSEARKLSKAYQEAPIETIPCLVVQNREDALHWIELRHSGELEGAGAVPWGSDEKARFRARFEGPGIHTQALNLLQERGDIAPEFRANFPTSTFERLLKSPDVRAKIGIGVEGGELRPLGEMDAVAKALLYIANDLKAGNTKVGDVYFKDQRTAYANKLPPDVVVAPTPKPGPRTATGAPSPTAAAPRRPAALRIAKPRDTLIPGDCVLGVSEPRIRNIEMELRRLRLEEFPNAVSVLLRVFIELTVDAYAQRVGLTVDVRAKLGIKLESVVNDLVKRQKLNDQQAKPARRAAQSESYRDPSIWLMHDWIHNQYAFPAASDLRAQWDSLQPFIAAIWAP